MVVARVSQLDTRFDGILRLFLVAVAFFRHLPYRHLPPPFFYVHPRISCHIYVLPYQPNPITPSPPLV